MHEKRPISFLLSWFSAVAAAPRLVWWVCEFRPIHHGRIGYRDAMPIIDDSILVAFHNLRRILITLNVVSLDALCSTSDSSHSPQHWMDYDRECDKNTTFSVINDTLDDGSEALSIMAPSGLEPIRNRVLLRSTLSWIYFSLRSKLVTHNDTP